METLRRRPDERLVPDSREPAVGPPGEFFQVVAEDDHDGFELLPVDALRAVVVEGPPEGGFGVLAQVVDFGAGVGVG